MRKIDERLLQFTALKYFIESYQKEITYKYKSEDNSSVSSREEDGIFTSVGPIG